MLSQVSGLLASLFAPSPQSQSRPGNPQESFSGLLKLLAEPEKLTPILTAGAPSQQLAAGASATPSFHGDVEPSDIGGAPRPAIRIGTTPHGWWDMPARRVPSSGSSGAAEANATGLPQGTQYETAPSGPCEPRASAPRADADGIDPSSELAADAAPEPAMSKGQEQEARPGPRRAHRDAGVKPAKAEDRPAAEIALPAAAAHTQLELPTLVAPPNLPHASGPQPQQTISKASSIRPATPAESGKPQVINQPQWRPVPAHTDLVSPAVQPAAAGLASSQMQGHNAAAGDGPANFSSPAAGFSAPATTLWPAQDAPVLPSPASVTTTPPATEPAFAMRLKPLAARVAGSVMPDQPAEDAPRVPQSASDRRAAETRTPGQAPSRFPQEPDVAIPTSPAAARDSGGTSHVPERPINEAAKGHAGTAAPKPAPAAEPPAAHTTFEQQGLAQDGGWVSPSGQAWQGKEEVILAPAVSDRRPPEATGTVAGQAPLRSNPAPTARSLQLDLNSAGERVAVRLAERGGTVQVDVRTSDSRLAGALREDLPQLAARMEQTGFRAEAWHPATAATPDRLRPAAPATAPEDMQQDPRQGHNRESQEEDRRRNSGSGQTSAPGKQNQKDFQWLFTSIR